MNLKANNQNISVKFTSILNNLAVGLLVLDAEGRVIYFNGRLLGIFGLQGAEINGQPYQEIFSAEVSKIIDSVANEIRNTSIEVIRANFDLVNGRLGHGLASRYKLEDSPKEVNGIIFLIHDVTIEKNIEQLKDNFIANVSHELRTPLTSIQGFAKIVKRKIEEIISPAIAQPDKKQIRALFQTQENLNIIISESSRLLSLINNLLDIAKMEANRMDWEIQLISIDEVVEEAVTSMRCLSSLLSNHGLEILINIEPSLPLIFADKGRLVQVLIQLLSNAIKFSDKCQPVSCKVRKTGEREITVSITDQGIGISPTDLKTIFKKFNQVGDVMTNKPQGMGLGLSICKQVVEYHGGRIWAESVLGEGSTFSFTLTIPDQNYVQTSD